MSIKRVDFKPESEMSMPSFCTNEHLEYLDALRESGKTNMFEAMPWISRKFPELTDDEANKVLVYWMLTFSDRHPPGSDVIGTIYIPSGDLE